MDWKENRLKTVNGLLDKHENKGTRTGGGRGIFFPLLVHLYTQQKIFPSQSLHSTEGKKENK